MLWLLLLAVLVVSLMFTGLLRRYALSRNLIDTPNARSSHTTPTPRGGGLAIVVCFLFSLPILASIHLISWGDTWALLGSGGSVAILGFLDDHGHIAARWRLAGHFCAAIWALSWIGGFPCIYIFGRSIDFGWLSFAFGIIYLVWMLNLYNFMDGIDGIASVEAIFACLGACLIYWLCGYVSLIWPSLLLSLAVFGFLYWNFPPARIFMGDAGSGFLGMTLGLLSIQAAWVSPKLFWAWVILLGVFIVDATLTLLRRCIRGERVYEAHRSHAYQFASRIYSRHSFVTLAVLFINIFWLLPIAIYTAIYDVDGLKATMIAYLPLVALALKFHAGEREKKPN
ncbi:glycosyltransferase family 4 protein [Pseudomonas sp. CCC3.2]|uniref:MraY family glycosyltransferase n=1 Tax=unclassified Pseudomonas TaxID=196821 RepID=UPI002AB53F88|nr:MULTISPECIES: glycosyltransferase family 4 protein [unclassified Pseudomonas]MDY7561393.1 glycosyltransferase family 4 protein [Pseudomonas sp. AB6]MEB0178925.1 glycosyltransferase family 4 protein [Pseudomonas sp. CCC3.2]MEB0210189.1 glycosyltransferase family 4 protein [Pseudomonas sp. AB6]